jgi:type IV secretory pathway VirB2 component (pilin)
MRNDMKSIVKRLMKSHAGTFAIVLAGLAVIIGGCMFIVWLSIRWTVGFCIFMGALALFFIWRLSGGLYEINNPDR